MDLGESRGGEGTRRSGGKENCDWAVIYEKNNFFFNLSILFTVQLKALKM